MFNVMSHMFFGKKTLYPPLEPFTTGLLPVGDGHSVYYEVCGNPAGTPIVHCHGGPGSASGVNHRRLFNPKKYQIVLFHQRGCGHSVPLGKREANTTQHLVADMEKLRTHLNLNAWHVYGGSWGAALAAVYAQTHPDKVISLTLQSLTLANAASLAWGNGGGAEQLLPAEFAAYQAVITAHGGDAKNPDASAEKLLFTGDAATQAAVAQAFSRWHLAGMDVLAGGPLPQFPPLEGAAAAALVQEMQHFFHYARNAFFLRDNQILADASALTMPVQIIHGALDMCCRVGMAYALHQAVPHSTLRIVTGAGHRVMHDKKLAAASIEATNALLLQ